jgi:microcin C transport system substrate-binding protein
MPVLSVRYRNHNPAEQDRFGVRFSSRLSALMGFVLLLIINQASAGIEVAQAISLYDQPKYEKGFKHFDFVNSNAPKGGKITLPALGTFDSLNPYVLKGISASQYAGVYGITELNEPLMVGTHYYLESGDEPQTAYCLLCEWVEFPADYSWMIFQLNPKARFHNGDLISAEDVANSYALLMSDQAHPGFANSLLAVDRVEVLSQHRVKFYFKGNPERSNLLRVGEMPVMSKKHWQQHRFGASSGTAQPVSGPYRVKDFVLGSFLTLERVPDFWAKDHPVYQGMFNFDEVRFEFYRDRTVAFEAFKSGGVDFWIEYVSKNWATGYDFPAVQQRAVIKEALPHTIPSGTQAFFLNMRRAQFQDLRVRKAISLMFDFQWINRNIFASAYRRSQSHFPNSVMGAQGLPSADEIALLSPFRDDLPPELFSQEFRMPEYNRPSDLRHAMREAVALLKQAGWEYQNTWLVNTASGQPFRFEILINNNSFQRVLLPFVKNLEKIGVSATIRIVDPAQYKVRLDDYDYDMIVYVLPQSASPGQEQRL